MENIPDLVSLGVIFGSSLLVGIILVVTAGWHGVVTGDFEASGVQKVHVGATPRIGLLPVLAGLLIAGVHLSQQSSSPSSEAGRFLLLLLLCSLPVVGLGVIEDLTKRVSPLFRLMSALLSGVLVVVVLDLWIPRTGFLPTLEYNWLWLIPLTLLAVAGFTNAINIIDGLNGLAAGCVLLMLAATLFVSYRLADPLLVNLCSVFIASLLGFMLLNFPKGLIFLGDGGAYLLGFACVGIWMLLLQRHPQISPMFIVAIGVHPVLETVYSIYRRRSRRARSDGAMAPDRLHLHSLMYRRAFPASGHLPHAPQWRRNSRAAMKTLTLVVPPTLLALVEPTSTLWNMAVILAYVAVYLSAFARLVRFRGIRRQRRVTPTPARTEHAR